MTRIDTQIYVYWKKTREHQRVPSSTREFAAFMKTLLFFGYDDNDIMIGLYSQQD